MMKEKIRKMMAIKDGFYSLLSFPDKLSAEENRQFWIAIEELVWDGSLRERFLALMFVAYMDNHDLSLKLLPILINKIDVQKEAILLKPTLSIIREYRCYKYKNFCIRILKFADETKNKEIFFAARRCLIVIDWQAILDDFYEMINQKKEAEVIDNLAFFRMNHDEKEWQKFQTLLNEEQKKYLMELAPQIVDKINQYEMAERMSTE